jgi:hypothetical protein
MLFWLLFGLIEVYFTRLRTPQALLVCVPPLAYFISHYLLLIRRKTLAESMLWLFLIGTLVISSLSVRNLIKPIDYSNLSIPEAKGESLHNKKIWVLNDSLSPYVSNKPSGFFLEWNLAKPVFHNPGYYQHVLSVANAFEKDPPDLILDPNNLMTGVLKYMPKYQAQYRREGNYYVRITE